jgi:ribosomal protein S18 acetylase RimI-like enzyme
MLTVPIVGRNGPVLTCDDAVMPLDVLGLTDDASVRPAVPADANAVAAIMARSYRRDYVDVLPAAMLAQLTPEVLVPGWSAAIGTPPSRAHRVLVACSGATVVGYAAIGPSPDDDARPQDGELLALEVDPMNRRAGHASRLLAAAADLLRDQHLGTVRTWLLDDDQPRRAFLTSAGMVDDGARRRYPDADLALVQVRFSALLAPEASTEPVAGGGE